MSHEEHKEFAVDQAYVLIAHADHLLCSLYSVHKILTEFEADFFNSRINSQIIDLIKKGKPISNIKVQIPMDKVMNIGSTLRQPFNTISHFQKFQNQCLHTLLDAQDASSSFALSYNTEFIMPLLELFVKYIKLHVLISQIKNIKDVPILYYYCKERIQTDKWNAQILDLSKYLKDRINFTILEAELQPLVKRFEDVLLTAKSHISALVKSDPNSNWTQFSLSENPTISPAKNNFMHLQYFVAIHLNLFVDALISFLFINVTSVPKFNDVFQSVITNHPYFDLVGDFKVPISTIFEELKHYRTKKDDLSISYFEKAAANEIDKQNATYRTKKVSSLIREFINAGESDISAVCFKIPIFFALLGYGNFIFTSLMDISTNDPTQEVQTSTIELLSTLTDAAFMVLKNVTPIRRFFFFNLREYDYPNLLALVYPLRLEKPLYDKVTYISDALQYIQLDEFDKGIPIDISPMKMAISHIISSFNKYSTNHGVVHLPPLFQLLSLISFHATIAMDPLEGVFESLKLYQFWQYRKILETKLSSTPNEFKGSVVNVLGLLHFYSYDRPMIAEYPDFYNKIPKYYMDMEKVVIAIFNKWVATQAENSFKEKPNHVALRAGETRFIVALRTLLRIGTITVCGEQYNLLRRILPTIKAIIPTVVGQKEVIPPISLEERISVISHFIRLCLLSVGVNPNTVISRNMMDVTHVRLSNKNGVLGIEGKMGSIPQMYYEFYTRYLNKSIKKTYYSTVLRTFIDKKEQSDKVKHKAPDFLSYLALSSLRNLLNDDGCKAFDILFIQTVADILESVSEGSNSDNQADSSALNVAMNYTDCLIHASAVLKARELFLKSKEDSPPSLIHDQDALLIKKLSGSKIIQRFDPSRMPSFIISIFSSSMWSNIDYDVKNGAFTNNAHLLPYIFDVIFTVMKQNNPEFDIAKQYGIMMKAIVDGIEKIRKTDKKLLMYILVDHIIKYSIYADYSMIEDVLPYQIIRSVYSSILQQGEN